MPDYSSYMSEAQKELFLKESFRGTYVRHNFRFVGYASSFKVPLTSVVNEGDPLVDRLPHKTTLRLRFPRSAKPPSEFMHCGRIVKRLLKRYTYRLRFSPFLPACNVEDFIKGAENVRQQLDEIRPKLVEALPRYRQLAMQDLKEAAIFMWRYAYQNEGKPPSSFVRETVNNSLESYFSEQALVDVCRFDYILLSVGAGEVIPEYVKKKQALTTSHELYSRVIAKRQAMIYKFSERLPKIGKGRGPVITSLIKLVQEHLSCLFYDDTDLRGMLTDLQDYLILTLKRDMDVVAEKMTAIIQYLAEDRDYPLFLTWKNGQILRHPSF